MAPLFAHPNEGKLRMAVAGNPLLHVEAAAGMWTGGVWRPVDVHMPDAQVVQYILEQATMRVIADKVWHSEGPFTFPRDFARVRDCVMYGCAGSEGLPLCDAPPLQLLTAATIPHNWAHHASTIHRPSSATLAATGTTAWRASPTRCIRTIASETM